MKLKKCVKCKAYNLTEKCRKCGAEAKSAHYKFNGLKDETRKFAG